VTLDGRITSSSGVLDDSLRKHLSIAMAELNNLGARNASIDLDRGTGAIVISCCVDVDDADRAVQPASDYIRLALHQGEIGTSNWPTETDPHWRVEFVRSWSEAVAV
jgi:hypothetical protein